MLVPRLAMSIRRRLIKKRLRGPVDSSIGLDVIGGQGPFVGAEQAPHQHSEENHEHDRRDDDQP